MSEEARGSEQWLKRHAVWVRDPAESTQSMVDDDATVAAPLAAG